MATEWTLETLHEHWKALRRDDQAAVASALSAAERAATKADNAMEKRFDGVNEFRAALADQASNLMPRAEYAAQHKALADQVRTLSDQLNTLASNSEGRQSISGPLMIGIACACGVGAFGLLEAFLRINGH